MRGFLHSLSIYHWVILLIGLGMTFAAVWPRQTEIRSKEALPPPALENSMASVKEVSLENSAPAPTPVPPEQPVAGIAQVTAAAESEAPGYTGVGMQTFDDGRIFRGEVSIGADAEGLVKALVEAPCIAHDSSVCVLSEDGLSSTFAKCWGHISAEFRSSVSVLQVSWHSSGDCWACRPERSR